jgi:hypothetical protein
MSAAGSGSRTPGGPVDELAGPHRRDRQRRQDVVVERLAVDQGGLHGRQVQLGWLSALLSQFTGCQR